MATERIPSSLAARKARIAISPRLATSSFVIKAPPRARLPPRGEGSTSLRRAYGTRRRRRRGRRRASAERGGLGDDVDREGVGGVRRALRDLEEDPAADPDAGEDVEGARLRGIADWRILGDARLPGGGRHLAARQVHGHELEDDEPGDDLAPVAP